MDRKREARTRLRWITFGLLFGACTSAPPARVVGPTLPLPELPPAAGRDGVVRPAGNSARAWSYQPRVAEGIGMIGKTLASEARLDPRGRAIVFAVVASRNHCLY